MQGSLTCPISATASIFTAQWPGTARCSGVSDFMTDERRLRPAAICGAHKPHVLAQLVDQKLAVAAPCARASCHGRSIRSEYVVAVVVDRCWPRPSDMEACSRLTRPPARPAATRSAAGNKQKVNTWYTYKRKLTCPEKHDGAALPSPKARIVEVFGSGHG